MKKILYCGMALFCFTAFMGCARHMAVLGSGDQLLAPIGNHREALTPDLQFLGKVTAPVQAGWDSEYPDAQLESESLVYGQKGNGGVVQKMLIIRTYQVRGESSTALPELDLGKQPLLDSGTVDVDSTQFAYKLLLDRGKIGEDEMKLIESKGLSMAGCYLLKAFSGKLKTGFLEKSVNHILYFESIVTGSTDAACTQFIQPRETKALVSRFNEAADGYVSRITGTADGVKSPSVKTPDQKAGTKLPDKGANELERKLTTLKDLLDKGLITQEDYNKKKEKLLEGL